MSAPYLRYFAILEVKMLMNRRDLTADFVGRHCYCPDLFLSASDIVRTGDMRNCPHLLFSASGFVRPFWKCSICKRKGDILSLKTHLKSFQWSRPGRYIWNHFNVNNAALYQFMQLVWRHIWRLTLERCRTNVTNETLYGYMPSVWRNIWKFILAKNHSNSNNATLRQFMQLIWWCIWKLAL